MTTDLERAAQKRLAYGHNDTCSYILSDTYACTCGHAELEAALSPAQPEGWDGMVWLVRSVGGEGPPQHAFCRSRDEIRHAIASLMFCPVESANWEEIDSIMESVDNKDDWSGEGTSWGLNFEIDGLEIIKLDPKAMLPSPPSPASPEGENTDIWCHTCDSVAPIDYKCSHPGCPIMKRASEVAPPADTRICTCHPDNMPPVPCPGKYAYSECMRAALAEREKELEAARAALREVYTFGGHAHWDKTGGSGSGCPLCITAREWSVKHKAALSASRQSDAMKGKP